ncbi:unnamed protein product [Parnassius apollo]|uniref:(apollo) hypothetical protein n=1 Tax=Parnassius apollo TaxID=110799 RepID=A0A8S3Y5W5_PARAO|nr:unnamed protein product [Parnassius apollo]
MFCFFVKNITPSRRLLSHSRNYSDWYPAPLSNEILSRNDYEKFQKSIPIIIERGVQAINVLKPAELSNRIKRIAEYSTQGRKFKQSEMTILCHEILRKPEEVKGELQTQQYILAFCVQMVMAYIIIMDDIEDGTKTRNGKPCWHLLPDVGSLAMNDASMFRSFIHEMLKQNFQGSTYVNILNLFNEAFLTCNVGQYFDAVTVRNRNYDDFTMERYKMIANHKFAYFSSKFPVLSALILCNKFNKDSQRNVANIMTDIGIWSQINNDLTDFFDDDKRTGKTGSDIQAGKCTWLAVTALQRCNKTQRKEFEACYGSWEPENLIMFCFFVKIITPSRWLLSHTKNYTNWCPAPVSKEILSRNDYEKFQKSIPIMIEKSVQAINVLKPAELRDRMKRIAEYYLQERNLIQSEMTILCHEIFRKPEEVKGELQTQQYILAFCVQMVMAYIIIMDDIEDGTKTRNGKLCWHMLPDVGSLAMNDASMFRSFIHEMLKQNFHGSTYVNIHNLFNENDLTDLFDDDKRTGKTGSDIQAGKCTWLAVTALQRCNKTQRKEFEACYGSWEPENVRRIRKLYEDLNILNIYFHEERATYEATVNKIQSLPSNALPSPDFFQIILDKYYPIVSCGKSYQKNKLK